MERLAKESVEDRAGSAGFVGRAHLAEDLAFPRDHRVEACGNAEEVKGGGPVLQPIERRAEVCLEGEQRRLGAPFRVRGGLVGEIELGAVARRQAHGLAGGVAETPCKLGRLIARKRGALPQLDGRAMVRDADEDDPHEKCVTGNASRTTATSTNPASSRYAARRPRRPAPTRSTAYMP